MMVLRAAALILMPVLQAEFAYAKTYGIVVSGLGGDPDYAESFSSSSQSIASGLRSLQSDSSLIISLGQGATRQDILDAIARQSQRMTDEQTDLTGDSVLVLVLVGHGNAGQDGWRFNVSGPDINLEDLIAALNSVSVSKQLVVLGASASGAALDALSQLGRVVLTATKSGGEINASRFHQYFGEAMLSDVADYDRNEILTVAEAYRFAETRTIEYYEQQNLLASEHSRLRGDMADEIAIALLGSLRDARDDPTVASLLDERLLLEQTFNSLKERKDDMPIDNYYQELEELLLSIAQLQQSIDEVTGWSDKDAGS